jgi:hypothetical protein
MSAATTNKFSGHSDIVGGVFDNLYCSGSTDIQSAKINAIYTSGSTNLLSSTAMKINASGVFKAMDCPKLGEIKASGNAAITRCKDIENIEASGDFSLESSNVTGNVIFSGHSPKITESTIEGTLECAAKIVKISNSTIGRIALKPIKSSSGFEFFGWKNASSSPTEQVVELSGKNCRVGSISFEDGSLGKVILRDGASYLYHARLGFEDSGGSQSGPDLDDREEDHIASIWSTNDRSKMDRSDGPSNLPNLTARGIAPRQ